MLKELNHFFYLLGDKKRKLPLLITLFLSQSLLDAVGLGLIGPFLALASNPGIIQNQRWLAWLYQNSGAISTSQFVAFVGLLIIVVFSLKLFLSYFSFRYIYAFSFNHQAHLKKKLLHAYLTAPYTFHLQSNTALLIQNITEETYRFCNGVLLPILLAVANGILIILLGLLLALTNFPATVIICGLILLAFVLHSQYRDKFVLWGKEVSEASTEVVRIVNHSLGGIKETYVIGCEPYFEAQLDTQVKRYAEASSAYMSINQLPRLIMEAALMLFLVGFVSLTLILTGDASQLIPTLSVFALTSIRLLPSATHFITAFGMIKNNSHTLDQLYLNLREVEKAALKVQKLNPRINYVSDFYGTHEPHEETDKKLVIGNQNSSSLLVKKPYDVIPEPWQIEAKLNKQATSITLNPSITMPFHHSIKLEHITYCYPGVKEEALDKICLDIIKGQSIALIGKSGAGKTTLVDLILGLLTPASGELKVDGQSIYKDLRGWQNLVGYIPQSIFLLDDTIEHNIAFGVPEDSIDAEKLRKAIQSAQLGHLIEELPDGLKTSVGERGVRLSGGQRQRVGIARALYHGREILVLDEATAALDNETEKLVTEAIRELSGTKTMIIIAHRLTTVKYCDRVYLLEKGKVIKSGSYDEVVSG